MRSSEEVGESTLRRLGIRVTGPRQAVARHLAGIKGSFQAESIARDLPNVGRATIYRTLKLLTEAGVLCKTTMHDGSPRYSFDSSSHHHHLICSTCGSVSEFHDAQLEELLHELAGKVPVQVLGHRVELYITCSECHGSEEPGFNQRLTDHGR